MLSLFLYGRMYVPANIIDTKGHIWNIFKISVDAVCLHTICPINDLNVLFYNKSIFISLKPSKLFFRELGQQQMSPSTVV